MFPYKGKMVMFQDITSKSKSIKSSLEDLKDISNLMFQSNKKTISKKQKELEEVFYSKDKEISHLRCHQEKLLEQVKKAQASKKELKERLLEQEEENLHLKSLNQTLVGQIKWLKDEKREGQNKVDSKDEECLRLKNHNQNLLKHIKELKDENKSLKNRFKELVAKEASKYPDVAFQTEETKIKTTNLAVQANPNHIEVKTYLEVVVQTEDTPYKDSVVKSTTIMPDGNQETVIKT